MIRQLLKNILPLISVNSFRRLLWYVRRGNFIALFQNMLAVLRTNAGARGAYRHSLSESLECLSENPQEYDDNSTDTYDIIVPVYNGFEFVVRALQSLLENTPARHRIIIVDDCSTDERIAGYLGDVSKNHPHVTLIRNPQNYGFVRSVNIAAVLTSGHFVIVNSDVEVPPGWLVRLMEPILTQQWVGSTTPFTNAGGICSFPVTNRDNEIFDNLDVSSIDRHFQKISPAHHIEIPTGIGFCMGINRQAYETIGMFDEKLFEKGYGEENDWCMRARNCGYRHLLVPNLFVYHKHGGSFSNEEKAKAIGRNIPRLISKYPEYQGLVNAFSAADPLKKLRDVMLLLLSSTFATGTEVVIDHDLGGGASHYRNELIRKFVVEGKSVLLILNDYHANAYNAIHYYKEYKTEYSIVGVRDLLLVSKYIKIDRITINSLVTYSSIKDACDTVLLLQADCGCRTRFLLHDYFPICPSYNLLNQEGKYCSVPATEKCSPCISRHHGDSMFHNYKMSIAEWRGIWSDFLQNFDEIVCFSTSSREIFMRAYPDLPQEKVVVEPHKVDYLEPVCPGKSAGPIVIGVLGSINHSKGIGILQSISEKIDRNNLPFRIVVIGRTSELLQGKNVTVTGGYERKDLPALIAKHHVDIIFIPSIWPETFSYTTEEAMQMGMPVAVFNLGAPAERVKNYPRGLILDTDDPLEILNELQELARHVGD